MKRVLSIILALVIFSTLLPINAQAVENAEKRENILKKASAVFPEYASKIAADTKPDLAKYSSAQRELVIS